MRFAIAEATCRSSRPPGSGKTEVVSQRALDLLADGVPPEGIVAFTFPARAAAELKERITERVEARLGRHTLDRLNGLFVGTIHSYCFRLLQQHVPRFETARGRARST
jgi:DNA helicase-2/ATP-dependent DNA helicase PcrA